MSQVKLTVKLRFESICRHYWILFTQHCFSLSKPLNWLPWCSRLGKLDLIDVNIDLTGFWSESLSSSLKHLSNSIWEPVGPRSVSGLAWPADITRYTMELGFDSTGRHHWGCLRQQCALTSASLAARGYDFPWLRKSGVCERFCRSLWFGRR